MSLPLPLAGLVKTCSHARHLDKCREKEELCCWWREERLRHRLPLKPRTRVLLRRLAMHVPPDVPLGNDLHEVALAAQTMMLDASCRRELGSAGAAIWRSGPRHGLFAGAVCNNLEIGAGKWQIHVHCAGEATSGDSVDGQPRVYEVGGLQWQCRKRRARLDNIYHQRPAQPRLRAIALAETPQCPHCASARLYSCGLHLCPRKDSPTESRAQAREWVR